jgi:hypothetical protein
MLSGLLLRRKRKMKTLKYLFIISALLTIGGLLLQFAR